MTAIRCSHCFRTPSRIRSVLRRRTLKVRSNTALQHYIALRCIAHCVAPCAARCAVGGLSWRLTAGASLCPPDLADEEEGERP